MQNATNAALDQVASTLGIQSDYAIAKSLHSTRASLSLYRAGKKQMGEETAVRAAEIAHLDPGLLLVQIQAERAKTPQARKVWESVAAMLESTAPFNAKSPA